jgi:hypothetical protein
VGGEGYCRECLEKQREIDRLEEQIKLLRDRLRYQERIAREEVISDNYFCRSATIRIAG